MGGTWPSIRRAEHGVVRNAPQINRSALFCEVSRSLIKFFCRLSSRNQTGAAYDRIGKAQVR